MYHYLYKITNLTNNKIYLGSHSSKSLSDGYMGSGVALKRAINKHGLSSFSKEILHVFDTREELYTKEAELVNENFIKRPDTYNMCVGGKGGQWKGLSKHNTPSLAQAGKKISERRIKQFAAGDIQIWNKGVPNPLGASNGKKGADAQRATVTGRRRHYLPDGKWIWKYPTKENEAEASFLSSIG